MYLYSLIKFLKRCAGSLISGEFGKANKFSWNPEKAACKTPSEACELLQAHSSRCVSVHPSDHISHSGATTRDMWINHFRLSVTWDSNTPSFRYKNEGKLKNTGVAITVSTVWWLIWFLWAPAVHFPTVNTRPKLLTTIAEGKCCTRCSQKTKSN